MSGTPESPAKSFKTLLFNGLVSATALAGATAIPILIQKLLTPPAPAPVQVQSVTAPQPEAQVAPADLPQEESGKGKKNKQD